MFLQLFHGLLCGLTCIESLVNYPGTLELRQFTMRGNKLKAERLVEAEPLAPVRCNTLAGLCTQLTFERVAQPSE